MKITLLEAAQVLMDDIDGLTCTERIGQINPIALNNLRSAILAEKKPRAKR